MDIEADLPQVLLVKREGFTDEISYLNKAHQLSSFSFKQIS